MYRDGVKNCDRKSINGALFFLMVNQGLAFMISTVNTFPKELVVFRREYSSGIYGIIPYYLSKSLSNFLLDMILGVMFAPIGFYMVGFSEDNIVFGTFLAILAMITFVTTSAAYMISCLAPSEQVAYLLAILFISFTLVPSGFIIQLDEVPDYYIWLRESSPYTWVFRLLMVNQWRDYGPIECSSIDQSKGFCTPLERPFEDGRAVLDFYDIKSDHNEAWIILGGMGLVYHILGVSALAFKNMQCH
eukprot:jgi/Bigna1/144919/aug1.93_g19627